MVRGAALLVLASVRDVRLALGAACDPALGQCDVEDAPDEVSMLAARSPTALDVVVPGKPNILKELERQAQKMKEFLEMLKAGRHSGTITCTAKKTTVWCAAGTTCCDKANAALCGGAGSTCCYNHDFSVANLCAPGTFCYDDGHCYATPPSTPQETEKLKDAQDLVADLFKQSVAHSPSGTLTCTAKQTTVWCSHGSTCCDKANAALCGGAGSTCCYNPDFSIANLCAPGTFCHSNGHCYASPETVEVPNPIKELAYQAALVKDALEKIKHPSGPFTCKAKQTTVWCAQGTTCCDKANAALCGGAGSTCCYNHDFSVANLCAPGTYCYADGHCYASPPSDPLAQHLLGEAKDLEDKLSKETATAVAPSGTFTCTAKQTTVWCSAGSVCCDEANAALCGGHGSTCCYNPIKTIANLCAPGTKCLPSGNCVAR